MPRNTVPWHGAVWHMTRARGTLTVIGDGAIGLAAVPAAKRLGASRFPGRKLVAERARSALSGSGN